MSAWQLVETAPKDGTWVWLSGGYTDEGDGDGRFKPEFTEIDVTRAVSAKWDKDFEEWVICYWDGAWRTTYREPTHWMLPEPPDD